MEKADNISNLFLLKDKVAVITGGAVNIGRAICLRLAEAGAKIAVTYHSSSSEISSLEMELTALGVESIFLHADLRNEMEVSVAVHQVIEHFGRIDVLVNNAGVFSLAAQTDLDSSEWDKVFEVNVRGLFLFTREVIKTMETKHPGGAIVNIASINAMHPSFGNTAHYDASKGAVVAYTKSLAAEVAGKGIRVNAVAPGLVDSKNLREQARDLANMVEARTPLLKLSDGKDVANAVLFLASAAASQITGETIVVDGGYLLT